MARVFVGLSGGVDSAVSAYLLKEAGHEVTGVFLKVWEPEFLPCTGAEDRLDAMRVAAHLGIPFKTYDVEEEYRDEVVAYMIEEYSSGRTPNPDVLCNRAVKFGVFWDRAQKEGAEYIATGHYVKKIKVESQKSKAEHEEPKIAQYQLSRGMDESKDQSYFLWTLTQYDLAHALFPLGDIQKSQVRTIARRIQLPNATKKDSQGICFLGHVDMKEFLKRYIPTSRGNIRHTDGVILGEHDGTVFYTLGQRISLSGKERLYVVRKDMHRNELIVSEDPLGDTSVREVPLERVHWIQDIPLEGVEYTAQLRYHGETYGVRIQNTESGALVFFNEPVQAAPGQSLVVYEGTRCVGGGVIQEGALK